MCDQKGDNAALAQQFVPNFEGRNNFLKFDKDGMVNASNLELPKHYLELWLGGNLKECVVLVDRSNARKGLLVGQC